MTTTTADETSALGACPDCGQVDGYLNAGRLHRAYCLDCKTTWIVGSNLFSSWRHETEDEQREKWEHIFKGTGEWRDLTSPSFFDERALPF